VDHPEDKEIQVCSNKVPKETYFYIGVYSKNFKNLLLMNHWPKGVSIVELGPQAL